MNRAQRRQFVRDKKKLATRFQEKSGAPREKAEDLMNTMEKIMVLEQKMEELLPVLEAQEAAHAERKRQDED